MTEGLKSLKQVVQEAATEAKASAPNEPPKPVTPCPRAATPQPITVPPSEAMNGS